MKNLCQLLLASLLLTAMSCTKINDELIVPIEDKGLDAQTALLVGKWQLVAIGTVTSTQTNPDADPLYSADKVENVDWESTSSSEILNFTAKNGFSKQTKDNNDLCKGTFRLRANALSINSSCDIESILAVKTLNESALIVAPQGTKEHYKYMKM